jgi:hypothetical protein
MTTPRGEKAIVSILGTGSNCSYFDGKELHQKSTIIRLYCHG